MNIKLSGRPAKSKDFGGLFHTVPLPVFMIKSRPKIPYGAKRRLVDGNGKTIFNLNNSTITHFACLDKHKELAIKNAESDGFKNVKAEQMYMILPKVCPSCNNAGTSTFNYDDRGYRPQSIPAIRIWYNHTKTVPKRCLVGTWRNGAIVLKKTIDIRKMSMPYQIKNNLSKLRKP